MAKLRVTSLRNNPRLIEPRPAMNTEEKTTVKSPYDIRDPQNWTLWVFFFNLNYKLASRLGAIGTKIHFSTNCPKKYPFLGEKNPRQPLSNHCITSETPVIGLYGSSFKKNLNYKLASRFGTIWTKNPLFD